MKLLVLVLRGLGAAHTGPHGNRWIDTSALNALAADGIVFAPHLAAHPDAEGAAWAWRTGCQRFPGAPSEVGAAIRAALPVRLGSPDLLAVGAASRAALPVRPGTRRVGPDLPDLL